MRSRFRVFPGIVVFLLALGLAFQVSAEIQWMDSGDLTIAETPRDITTSLDGRWLFFLFKGEIAVYDQQAQSKIATIPVDSKYDRITYSDATQSLLVASTELKSVKRIRIDDILAFDLSNLPSWGPKDAAVTIVIFSDYQ